MRIAERKNALWSDLVDLMIGLAFISGGAMILQILGFIAVGAASDWRDAHTSANGVPTWWEALQQIGGGYYYYVGTIYVVSLPSTAIIYGSYYFVAAVRRITASQARR